MNDQTRANRATRRRGVGEGGAAATAAPVVRAGLPGGRYRPLSEAEVARVNEAVLEVLETIGMGGALPSCVELVTRAGGTLTEQGRLLFPRALVQQAIASAARNFTLHARDPRHDLHLNGTQVHFGTAGAAVSVVNCETRDYRDSALTDLYDMARLVDRLDNIHFYQRPVVARDLPNPRELDFNTCYASVAGTTKHVGTSFMDPSSLPEIVEMLDMIAGGPGRFRERPFVSASCCFSVPPLRFGDDACQTLEAAVRCGMPVLLLSASQAGATAPAALAGTVVLAVAEVLAGLVYVNLLSPGFPAICGTWPFVSDLRTGAMSGGSGEEAVLAAACAQMMNFYDLPGGTAAGMTDSKIPDVQGGYEKGYTLALAGQAGANMVYEAAGMHGSLMGMCYESLVIDNDLLGAVQRTLRGVEVTDSSLSIDVMREVCIGGPGHFLGSAQTMALMKQEYLYPQVGDRTPHRDWFNAGARDAVAVARERVQEILDSYYPSYIDPAVDAEIRARFPIRLATHEMQPDPAGWRRG